MILPEETKYMSGRHDWLTWRKVILKWDSPFADYFPIGLVVIASSTFQKLQPRKLVA